jgi:hypothetical protein
LQRFIRSGLFRKIITNEFDLQNRLLVFVATVRMSTTSQKHRAKPMGEKEVLLLKKDKELCTDLLKVRFLWSSTDCAAPGQQQANGLR